MNELALFAGIGGGILGGKLLGWRTVCAVEFEPYAACVLAQRQNDGLLPAFPIWDDIRTFDGIPWRGRVDVVSGGFPCQAYSSAASGRNTADDLWPEMLRVVADVAPRHVFAENVQRRAIDRAADELESLGYAVRCLALSAKDVGADHIRERYWLLAYADMHSQLCGAEHAKARLRASVRQSPWASKPPEPRMADGLPNRMERLVATGNGQVPLCAAIAFEELSKHFD